MQIAYDAEVHNLAQHGANFQDDDDVLQPISNFDKSNEMEESAKAVHRKAISDPEYSIWLGPI